jgi:hypothetical protein
VIHIFAVMDFGGPVNGELEKVALGATFGMANRIFKTRWFSKAARRQTPGIFALLRRIHDQAEPSNFILTK